MHLSPQINIPSGCNQHYFGLARVCFKCLNWSLLGCQSLIASMLQNGAQWRWEGPTEFTTLLRGWLKSIEDVRLYTVDGSLQGIDECNSLCDNTGWRTVAGSNLNETFRFQVVLPFRNSQTSMILSTYERRKSLENWFMQAWNGIHSQLGRDQSKKCSLFVPACRWGNIRWISSIAWPQTGLHLRR